MHASQIHSHLGPRSAPLPRMTREQVADFRELSRLGIHLRHASQMASIAREAVALDDTTGLTTTASIATPVQFLQNWLPGVVFVITKKRKIDNLIGVATVGSWEDEEIVQTIIERTGSAVPYGDSTNVPFANWNPNFERRTIVRFEQGLQVNALEEARAARIRTSSSENKRAAAGISLEVERNQIGFFGYNDGLGRTYGFLNDPNLLPYIAVPPGASGSTSWTQKTFNEIVADIISTLALLRTQSGDVIDPEKDKLTMAISTNRRETLSTVNSLGSQSVYQWLVATYPNIRVESAPELDQANGGENVFYMYAETVDDSGTDGGVVFMQCVPSKFMTIGVAKTVKGSEEDYSNATAGVLCKRPYANVRRTGI